MKELAIITGATSGIGYEFSKLLNKESLDILLISRNLENLNKVKKELEEKNTNKVDVLSIDLSENTFYKTLTEYTKNYHIKYLINNAGFGDFGKFIDVNISKQQNMINLNIKALTTLTHIFLENNKCYKNKKSYLLNVASIAGFMPGPLMSVYYATKSYVISFTRAIRFEEKNNKNINISILCPGPTTTNFIKSSNLENSKLFDKVKNMSPEKVVKICYKQMLKNKELIIPGVSNKLMVLLSKIFPHKLSNYFVYLIMKNK